MPETKEIEKPAIVKSAEEVFGGQMTVSQIKDMGLDKIKNFDFASLSKNAEQVVAPGAVDKTTLLGVPFVIAAWDVAYSENYGAEYIKVALITEKNEPKSFVDFGTGIKDVLIAFEQSKGKQLPILCREGLRVSKYDARVKDGVHLPAGQTFYLT